MSKAKTNGGKKLYQCRLNQAMGRVAAAGPTVAELDFNCADCMQMVLHHCDGPIEVPADPAPVKRRGRQPFKKPEPVAEPIKAVTVGAEPVEAEPAPVVSAVEPAPQKDPASEDRCREALKALAIPRQPDYAGIVRMFREEIQAARAAGRGWNVISDALKKHGYPVGPDALKTAMSKASE